MTRAWLVFVCGCSLAVNFDRTKAIEQEALCDDGVDNDGDGLTDCQDWKCADHPACCTIPVIELADDFEHDVCSKQACGSSTCPASPEVWQAWGSPLPEVCGGAFVPGKLEQCYDVGLLGVAGVPLRPGLVVSGGFAGTPEPGGRVRLGVTFQDQALGSLDPCAPIAPVELAIGITMQSTPGGYRFVAQFGQQDVAASATLADGERHELALRVLDDRRVRYELDGVAFATSAASETVPAADQTVHVVLMGRGATARIEDVQVTVGARCEDPTAWAPAPQFLAFGTAASTSAWDSFAVYGPAVVAGDPETLFYGGCAEAVGACDPVDAGYGRALLGGDGFSRDATCPLFSNPGLVCTGGLASPFTDLYNNVYDLDVARGADGLVGVLSQQGGAKIVVVEQQGASFQPVDPAIEVGQPGSWNAAEVCCASVVVDDDGGLRIWYSGRATPGGPRRIGVAKWTPAGVIQNANNPVLAEGEAGGIDDHGVHDPDVIWDADRELYRMWYVADGPLGLTSIAYAVSTDGVRWHEAPQNPIVTAETVGLRRIGAPAVVSSGGELEMWIEGVSPSHAGAQIYRLVNAGTDP